MEEGDAQRYGQIASLAAFTVAGLCLLAWLFRLSVLVTLISDSILVGFKIGAGLTIAMTQLPSLSCRWGELSLVDPPNHVRRKPMALQCTSDNGGEIPFHHGQLLAGLALDSHSAYQSADTLLTMIFSLSRTSKKFAVLYDINQCGSAVAEPKENTAGLRRGLSIIGSTGGYLGSGHHDYFATGGTEHGAVRGGDVERLRWPMLA
jgi:hypothetical protein